MPESPFTTVPGGIRARIRLAPKAARTHVGQVHTGADGRRVLKVSVTAPPEGGKANAALLKALARAWRLPKSSLAIIAGATDRNKTVFIEGDAGVLAARLEHWRERDHD